MKKIVCLLLSAMLVMSGVSALADNLILGGIAPLTGPVSVYGIAVKNAAELYVAEINAAGGVLGQQVEIRWQDDKHNPTEAINAYNLLFDVPGIAAILGPVTSSPTLAIVDMVAADGIPMLTPTGTSDLITEVAHGNVFRACFKDSFQGTVMASFAVNSLQGANLAVLYDNTSDYSIGIAENFKLQAEALGAKIVSYEACTAGSGDYKAQLTNIAATNPDSVFVPMYYNDVALIVKQAHEAGITAPLLGVDGWDGVLDIMEDTALLEGYFFCNHYAADDASPAVAAFRAAYEAAYGDTPNALAALGYDGIAILLKAIEAAGGVEDWDAISEALFAVEYDGVTGYIRYNDFGDPVKATVIISIVEGEFKFFERVDP